jgi:hypothetical protein
MPFAPWVLLTAALAAPGFQAPGDRLAATLPVSFVLDADGAVAPQRRSRGRAGPDRRTQSGDPPHTFGLGGAIGVSNHGAGGAFRYWFGKQVGVEMTAAWYRGQRYSPTISTGSTVLVMPSVLFLLAKPDPKKDVDIRPFVGGGISYSRGGYYLPVTPSAAATRAGGMGMQTFGGLEMTFKEWRAVAVSAEVVYYRLPLSIANSTSLSGVTGLVMFHFYLK